MAEAVKYQVFLSSTYEDLKDERDQVIKAVLEMGHIPVGMEMFSAADEEQWQIIRRHIDESDYYVVIVAHRYGSITDGVSYTRKEYEYALSVGVPVLGFVIEKGASWPGDRFDRDEPEKSLLVDFKMLVESKPVNRWTSAGDLHAKVSISLMKAFNATPRDGWVRASALAGPQTMAELSRLSAENGQLRRELEAVRDGARRSDNSEMARLVGTLSARRHKLSYRYAATEDWRRDGQELSLLRILDLIGPSLVPEYAVAAMARLLALNVRKDPSKRSDIVPYNLVKSVLLELMALDLVEPSKLQHSKSDDDEYWSLSEYGLEFVKWRRRLELMSEPEAESEASPETASTESEGPAKKAPAKKAPAKKAPAKKAPAKKAPA